MDYGCDKWIEIDIYFLSSVFIEFVDILMLWIFWKMIGGFDINI